MHSVPSTQSKLRQVLGLHKTSEKKLTRLKWLVEKVYKRKNLEITVQRFIKLLNRIGLIWLLIGMLSVESCVYTLRSNFSHSNSFISPPPDSFYYVLMWIVIHGYNKGKSCKCKWKRKKRKKKRWLCSKCSPYTMKRVHEPVWLRSGPSQLFVFSLFFFFKLEEEET